MATLWEQVREVIADKLGVDISEVVPDASFTEDLNADSLDLVELLMAFEEKFSTPKNTIEISDEDAEKVTTPRKAYDYLVKHGIEDDRSIDQEFPALRERIPQIQ